MCKAILSDLHLPRNPHADLLCPDCRREVAFSSAKGRIWCLLCGWQHTLTADQARDLVDALAGITTLPVPAYLHLLTLQDLHSVPNPVRA